MTETLHGDISRADVARLHLLHCAETDVLCTDNDSRAVYRNGQPLPPGLLPVARELILHDYLHVVVDDSYPASLAQRVRLTDAGIALLRDLEAQR